MNSKDIAFSFADQHFQDNPTTVMSLLRDECPVHLTSEPSEHYTLTRGEDVTAALRDDKLWSSKFGPGLAYSEPGVGVLVSSDPPEHTQERIAIARIFKASTIEKMERKIVDLTDELIDQFETNMSGDIIEEFAAPIPLTVMCWLLGTPVKDIGLFRSWVLPMAEAVAFSGGREASAKVKSAYQDFFEYFGNHIVERKDLLISGQDIPEDLLTRLLTVTNDGKELSIKKILGFCQFLLVAGSETTTLMIGNVLHRLMEYPEQFEVLKSDPDLIPNAIEESLRFDAPVHGLFRTNTEDVTIHGVSVPIDSKVCMMFGSANRDPNLWKNPDVFDINRDPMALRNHTSFGVGPHYCLGAPLSRLEGKVALEAILRRLPRIRANGSPTQTTAGVLKGFSNLPVRWD